MTPPTELDRFRSLWNAESEKAVAVMRALPEDQYDFGPDPSGRSLGELAWHLAEIDACLTFGVATGRFSFADNPPNLARPKEIKLLAPRYQQIHEEALARLADFDVGRLDEAVSFFDGRALTLRDVLWTELLLHLVHHRGQLTLLCRQAGAPPPGLFGPNREEMRAMMEAMQGGG